MGFRTPALLVFASCALINAQPAVTTTPEEDRKHSKTLFNSLTKSLPQEKRPQFMELMKKMRQTRMMKKEQKRGIIMQLDGEIHKLLGDDYKRYRAVQDHLHAERQAKANLPPPKPPLLSSPPPPPPSITLQRMKKGGKKKKLLKGTIR